jgi:hydroxymethylglutaryl-CoA reductase (NADPH)
MRIPDFVLKKLYTEGSLANGEGGARFALKNRLSDAELVGITSLAIDGRPLALSEVKLDVGNHRVVRPAEVDPAHPLPFPVQSTVTVLTGAAGLSAGRHEIEMAFEARPFGQLRLCVEDAIGEPQPSSVRIPRDHEDDYSPEIAARRRAVIEEASGVALRHVAHYSFDPHCVRGNCESFVGVAQVPLGFVGPLLVRGEHANGRYVIPMATSEGTMIASYNRGMKVLNLCGGAKATVLADAMQRAPVFILGDARQAREFARWVEANVEGIRAAAQATSSYARLLSMDPYLAAKFVYLRFNFSTGDAAGQNMVGRATFAACKWILEHAEGVVDFSLEANFATDKKSSYVNVMRTRGKRVTAEAVIPREIVVRHLRADPDRLVYHYSVANVGAFLSGANNNGLQSANGIAAMFIATGQDVANVAESSAGILYVEPTPARDLYVSLTIPSLIVATHGGGTGLPTQRECLEVLDCYGKGKVNRLAEIVAAVALAGELSLAGAIASSDWVTSHEKFGRNR